MQKIIILFVAALTVACKPTAKLPTIRTQGDTAFEQADYGKAYTLYQEFIALAKTHHVEIDQTLYAKQAQACALLDKVDEASTIYTMLLEDEANIKLIAKYAQMLQSKGKEDDELALWTSHKEKLKEAELIKLSTERLIFLNASKENYQAVVDAYGAKGDIQLSKETQLAHVRALEATEKAYPALKACNLLLNEAPDYIEAIEWKAKYYYNKAEKRYQYEMAKYNKKKNATTYAYLRRDLKKISADFRISRDIFLNLRKQDAADKNYIRHLKNIYLRLDQKKKAVAMDKLFR